MPSGGPRPNSGRPKGRKTRDALAKEAARELVRQQVTASLGPLVDAQIKQALGLSYLVTRDKKTGKFIRVTKAMARRQLGSDEEIIEVWEKDPSTPAFVDLMNRALDKPREQEQTVRLEGQVSVIEILRRRLERNRSDGEHGPNS